MVTPFSGDRDCVAKEMADLYNFFIEIENAKVKTENRARLGRRN